MIIVERWFFGSFPFQRFKHLVEIIEYRMLFIFKELFEDIEMILHQRLDFGGKALFIARHVFFHHPFQQVSSFAHSRDHHDDMGFVGF